MGPILLLALTLCAACGAIAVDRRRLRSRLASTVEAAVADAVEATDARWRSLVVGSAELAVVVGADGVITYATPACGSITGSQLTDAVHPGDAPFVVTKLTAPAPSDRFELRLRNGTWVEASTTNLLHEPAVAGVVVKLRDISERKAAEEQLRRQARHDQLTGLPNRAELTRVIEYRPGSGATDGVDTDFALLLMDLDRFKEINDGLGHHIGDQVLIEVARRLSSAVREGDTVVRLGGDEFAIVAEGVTTPAGAVAAARRLAAHLDPPVEIDGMTLYLRGSVGIAIASREAATTSVLLQRADVAMYRAKEQGLGCAVFGQDDIEDRPARLALLGDLRRALDDGRIEVHYQPQVDLATGEVVNVEALARWTKDGESVPPAEFIPLAEHSGLIRPLTRLVLQHALDQLRRWSAIGLDLSISVNISPSSLRDPALVTTVAEAIMRSRIEPARLTLEITESALAEHTDTAVAVLNRLRQIGVRLSIDDFGSGYSSMAYLKRLPIDELKIDRSFVMELDRDPRDAPIVQAITTLGRSLGLLVVGEGVESSDVGDMLRSFGCHRAQGYAIHRPSPGPELTLWLEARTRGCRVRRAAALAH
jgi:diguanylate cyclase (GGDEF)-like protein